MTTLVVINPHSRNGDIQCDEILDALSPLGPLETLLLGNDESVSDKIKSIPGLKRIIVAGGDGTLNCVLPDVLSASLPMGVIPLGTANDFARTLNMPLDPVTAAEAIAQGGMRHVDVGLVNGKYFLNAVGVGLGPDLTRQLDKEKKKRLGVLAYVESLTRVFGASRRRFAKLVIDGERQRTAFVQVTIANGRFYGGGMTVSEDVQTDDGRLHLLCVQPMTAWQLFLRGLRFKFGKIARDEKLIYQQGTEICVSTKRKTEVTADGELVTKTPIVCRCLHRALQVYVPLEEAEKQDEATTTSMQLTAVAS